MAMGMDPGQHVGACCCLACANVSEWEVKSAGTVGWIDPSQPVEQNAGGTSFPVSDVSGDGIQIQDAVLSGYKWNTTQLTFSFPDSMSDYEYGRSGTFEAFNSAQKAAALYALDMIAQYTQVRFTQLTGSQDRDADIRLAEESSAPTAYAYYPSSSAQGGDVWFNTTSFNSPALGNYAFSTLVHEVGHALGLKHGHDTSFAGALPYEYDSFEYSVMTYRSYVGSSGSSYSAAPDSGPQTYMMADIGALQIMYGANYATQSGNTVYSFDTATGQMRINGVGQLDGAGNKIFRTIWDGNGVDTYDFSNFTTRLGIDLRPGEGTDLDVGGLGWRADLGPNTSSTFNKGYARKHVYNALLHNGDARSLIENAKGGSGDDIFVGNDADNRFEGGAGNDRFHDSAGSDTYIGGAGSDEVLFGGLFSSYSFSVGASFLEVIGDFVDFVYDSVERLLFSDQSWTYSDLAASLSGSSPDAVGDGFSVDESDSPGLTQIGSVLANDTDSQQLPLSVSAVNGQEAAVGTVITLASGASLKVAADGTVSYGQNGRFAALQPGETATETFTYTVTNGSRSDTATVTITIAGTADPNAAPVAVGDAFGGAEGAAISGDVMANDSDPDGDALSVTAVNGGATTQRLASGALVSMASDGRFTYSQDAAFDHLETGQQATDSFSYTVSDGKGGTAGATVTITIDGVSPPSPDAVPDAFSIDESNAAGLALIGSVLANDSDSDNRTLMVSAVNGQSASVGSVITLASGASLRVASDGSVSYGQNGRFDALQPGQTATDSFAYTVTNGTRSDTATVTITIRGTADPNAAPVARADAVAGNEGTAIGGNVLANDSDPDGDALTVVGVNGGGMDATLSSGASVSMAANGTFTYWQNGAFDHLQPGQVASDQFGYSISDGRGGLATATVTVTIQGAMSDLTPRPGDLTGTSGSDSIRGTPGNQALFGFDGDDFLEAKFGSDILVGGAGNDTLKGYKHEATVFHFGTEQNNGIVEIDTIENFQSRLDGISLNGGRVVNAQSEGKHLRLTLAGDGDQILIKWLSSVDQIDFLDTVPNRAPDPENRDLLPSWGDIAGTGSSETLTGTAAGERIFGLGGSDWLEGGGGRDVLIGGSGNDKLFGGAGEDTFVFQSETRDGVAHFNAILDWEPGDRIQLIGTRVVSHTVQHNGIVLTLEGDGDQVFVKHVYDMDELAFV